MIAKMVPMILHLTHLTAHIHQEFGESSSQLSKLLKPSPWKSIRNVFLVVNLKDL